MKKHIGRLACGGIILTGSFVIVWAVAKFEPYSLWALAAVLVMGIAYGLGAFVAGRWENK